MSTSLEIALKHHPGKPSAFANDGAGKDSKPISHRHAGESLISAPSIRLNSPQLPQGMLPACIALGGGKGPASLLPIAVKILLSDTI
jgi:hypothetical protein